MSHYIGSTGFRHGTPQKLGVLVVNLGTPDAPETGALRRYLKQFLWDPRVVEVPRPLWWLVLNGFILNFRPPRSAALYRKVWTAQGSPLLKISREQLSGLEERLAARLSAPVEVALGMRYGNPSIAAALSQFHERNVRRLLVLPLYPQYSGSTTGSTFDALAATLTRWRWIPELRFINGYHDEAQYIDALASSISEHWAKYGRGEHLLMSFHGVPRRYLDLGDPYHCQCLKTGRLLAERLGLEDARWSVTFQSRFGREEWLKPYTDDTIRAFGRRGLKRIDVICPGFSADCLETLEEIAQQNAEFFHEAGGDTLSYIPCLNARPDHLEFLASHVIRHLQGWREADPVQDAILLAAEEKATSERAAARIAAREAGELG